MEALYGLPANPAILIPIGLLLGLLGYRLYRVSLFIAGLYVGLMLGEWIGASVDNATLGIWLGLVLGLAFGVATHFLLRLSFFLAGMAGGITLASWILPYTQVIEGSTEAWLWGLGAAVAGGLLTLALYRVFILAMTSLLGAWLIRMGTLAWFPDGAGWTWVPFVILFAVFLAVQAGSAKSHPDPMERERERRDRRR